MILFFNLSLFGKGICNTGISYKTFFYYKIFLLLHSFLDIMFM